MRELTCIEIDVVSGGDNPPVEPLIKDPKTTFGEIVNEAHEAYITFLNMYVFPLIYYCL